MLMMTKYLLLPFDSSLVGFCIFRRWLDSVFFVVIIIISSRAVVLVVSRQRMRSSKGGGSNLFAIDHIITF